MPKGIEIISQGYIETPYDFVRLDLVDWNRAKVHERQHIMDAISSWFVCTSYYYILKVDLLAYPERNDFPGWKHAGHHEDMGKLYWNFFHDHFEEGTLKFADSPDFSGSFIMDGKTTSVYGDIGHVSPIGMREAIACLKQFDNWVTVVDTQTQIIIQPFMDIWRLNTMSEEEVLQQIAPFVKNPQTLFQKTLDPQQYIPLTLW
jgi:hypothetical protein